MVSVPALHSQEGRIQIESLSRIVSLPVDVLMLAARFILSFTATYHGRFILSFTATYHGIVIIRFFFILNLVFLICHFRFQKYQPSSCSVSSMFLSLLVPSTRHSDCAHIPSKLLQRAQLLFLFPPHSLFLLQPFLTTLGPEFQLPIVLRELSLIP